jgi:hypothetical protein
MTEKTATPWVVVEFPGPGPFQTYFVAQVDADGTRLHTHPIPFPYRREADRAAARLNLRDAGMLAPSVPKPSDDEARAARLARIAELRGRRGRAGYTADLAYIDEPHGLAD